MKNRIIFILAVCFFCASSFTTKSPITQTPDQIARSLFKSLLASDSTTFAQTYDIDVPDLEWYKKKIETDTFISEETKEDFIEEFTAYMHKSNKELPHTYNTKWFASLSKHGIKKEDIKYINSYYTQTNKRLGIQGMSLEIKFLYKGSYYFIELSLLEINGKWKGININNVDACDKYFDGY